MFLDIQSILFKIEFEWENCMCWRTCGPKKGLFDFKILTGSNYNMYSYLINVPWLDTHFVPNQY